MSPAQAQQVPEVITYQGTLTDPDGNAVNSTVDLAFRFYSGPDEGAAQLPEGDAWEEAYTGVPVQNGRFSVQLGSQTPLPDALFNNRQQLWLEIVVDDEALPRARMTSTAFAREAQSVVDGAAVQSLNGLTDAVTLSEGENVSITQGGSELTISATVPNGGLTSVQTNETLSGVGTEDEPLGLAEGAAVRSLTALNNSGGEVTTLTDGVTVRAGDNVEFVEQSGGLTISAAGPEGGISSVSSNQTLDGNGTSDDPLRLAPDAVTSANIFDGEVKSDDLGPGAVTEAKILDGAVTTSKINEAAAVKSLNTITGEVSLISSDESLNLFSSATDSEVDLAINPSAVVAQLNELTGPVSLVGGENVNIESNDADQLTISSTDTGLREVASDATLAGTGADDDALGIAENGVGRTELADGVVVDQLNGLTGGVTIQTSGGAQISRDTDTNTITIDAGAGSGSSDIQSISSPGGTIDVVNNDGSVSIDVADGGVGTAQLAGNAVTGDVIQDGSVQGADLADGAVDTDQLANGAVTANQLAGGSVSTAALQNNAVTSNQIADGTITADELGTGSVGSTEIQDGAVTRDDLSGNAAVLGLTPPSNNTLRGEVSLAAGENITISDSGNEITIDAAATGLSEVATSDQFEGNGTEGNELSLALDAVTQAEIATGAVGSDELQDNTAVTGLSIQNNGSNTIGPLQNSVTLNGGNNISLGRDGSIITIDAGATGLQSVTSDATLTGSGTLGDPLGIANGSVDTDQLANGAVTAAVLANNAVDTGALQDGAVTGVKIADGTLVGGTSIGISRTSGDALEINFTGSTGDGDITAVNTGPGISGGGDTGDVTLSIENGDIVGSMLDANAVQGGTNVNVSRNNGNFLIEAPNALTEAVTSLSGAGQTLTGGVTLQAGNDIGITNPSEGTLEIAFTGSTSGAVTSVSGGAGIDDGGQSTGDVTLSIGDANIAGSMLAGAAIQGGANVSVSRDGDDNVIVAAPNALTSAVTSLSVDGTALTDDLTLAGGSNVTVTESGGTITIAASDDTGVSSLDGATGALTLGGDVSGAADGTTVNVSLAGGSVNSNTVEDNTLSVNDIGPDAVDASELADGAVDAGAIQNEAVTETALDVTNDPTTAGQVLTYGGSNNFTWETASSSGVSSLEDATGDVTLGGDIEASGAGSSVTLTLGTDVVTSTEILDGEVTTADLASGAVTQPILAAGSASSGQVLSYDGTALQWVEPSSGGVSSLNNLTGALSLSNTNGLSISEGSNTINLGISDGAIGTNELATDAVTSSIIDNGTITTADLADGSVGTGELADGVAVRSLNGQTEAIDLTSSDGSVAIDASTTGQINLSASGATTVSSNSTLSGDGSSTNPLSVAGGGVSTAQLAPDAVTSSEIDDGTITASDLGPGSVGASEIANGSVAPGDLDGSGGTDGQALITNGTSVSWGNPDATVVADDQTISGTGTSGDPLTVDQIGSTEIVNGSIESVDISDGTITADDLDTDAVTSNEIAANAVTGSELADGTAVRSLNGQTEAIDLTSTDGTVAINASAGVIDLSASTTTSVETDGTLAGTGTSGDPLSVNPIGSDQITDESIVSADIDDGSVAPVDLNTDGAASANQALIFDGTTATWGTPAVATDGLTIAGDGAATNLSLADGAVTTAKLSPTPPTVGDGNQVLTWSNNDNELIWQAESMVTSSIRWKENVRTLDRPLQLVEQLRGVRYDWTESGAADVGVIAEEVAEVLPELVEFDEGGQARGVHYAKLAAVLIEATKAQQQAMDAKAETIEDQRRTIAQQQDEIDALKSRMDRLEHLVEHVAASESATPESAASGSEASSTGDARQ